MSEIERESMEYDVVIVGAGPAGLSAAIRLKQIDTNQVKPLHNVTNASESIRNDEINKHNSVEEILNNAPERAQNFFKVPKVVE